MNWMLMLVSLFTSLVFVPISESEANTAESSRVTVGQLMLSNSSLGQPYSFSSKFKLLNSLLLLLLFAFVMSRRLSLVSPVPQLYRRSAIPLRLKRLFLNPLQFQSNCIP
ncbi:hypothetical protein [Cohnella sp. AR92]|uniref:hypothetical protein n=1 Tax=Cohnella sp. AR92 TaxID=648716 RepID=UPI000F8C664B|nr:hypothetical protein [Cohnella sp. AR92]RUS47803.1 hypothetical protein ELR57_08485 [Cohnella sp. AR92]